MLHRTVRPFWPCLLLPAICGAWAPGYNPTAAPSRGFVVDTSSRNEVTSFWHAIYEASEGYRERMGWTGSYTSVAAGAEGTTSAVFVADTERRLNFYRALAGVPANAVLNSGSTIYVGATDANQASATTTKAAAAQRSALMICRNYSAGSSSNPGINHDPASSCTAWTKEAWNANRNSNLTQGFFGPGAIDAFIQEEVPGLSTWNAAVGHRRWTLKQTATNYATGNIPGSYNSSTGQIMPPTSTLYVFQKADEVDATVTPRFTLYPSAGYFPAKVNTPFWSVSFPGANFTRATVTMSDATGSNLPVTIVSTDASYADSTLVWKVLSSVSAEKVTTDTRFNVSVSGISGTGVPTSVSYSVTLFDPYRLNEQPVVSGTTSPPNSGISYNISRVNGAETMQTGFFLRHAATWTEGAEDSPTPAVIASISPAYSLRNSEAAYARTGGKSFRLTSPTYYDPLINGVPEQSFEVDRDILPLAGGTLKYYYRRGYMSASNRLAVEYSADQGVTWSALGPEVSGGSSGQMDTGFTAISLTLPSSSVPLRVRFRYYYTGSGSMYTLETSAAYSGIFIDDITTANCDVLERKGQVNTTTESTVAFNSTTAGQALEAGQEWWLRERAVLGGHAFPYGPALVVSPVGALQIIGSASPPAGGGASYTFVPSAAVDSYTLQVETMGPATWVEGAEASPAPEVTDNTATTYDLLSSQAGNFATGARSFRLALITTDTEDSFTILRPFTAAQDSVLKFWTKRGTMAATNLLHLEVSTDGGTSWGSAWSLAGNGNTVDTAGTTQLVSLSAFAGREIRVRFAIRKGTGANLTFNATKSGVWIDDIRVENGWTPTFEKDTSVASSARLLRLDTATAGGPLQAAVPVRMRLRPVSAGVPGASGPAFLAIPTVSPTSGYSGWIIYDYPLLQQGFDGDDDGDGLANGLEYAFGLDPMTPATMPQTVTVDAAGQKLSIAQPLNAKRSGVTYEAEWSSDLKSWSTQGVTVELIGGQLVATAPSGSAFRYMRWKISGS